jgi:uncharacterized MAPEG superfamily protein
MDSPAFHVYALTSAILAVHLLVLAFVTGGLRGRRKTFVLPEDAVLNKVAASDREHPDTIRAQRAHMNALENAVPFFVVGALYVATGATTAGAQGYFYTFLAARLLHTVFYFSGRQPFRSISFGVGALAVLGMAFHVIRAVI